MHDFNIFFFEIFCFPQNFSIDYFIFEKALLFTKKKKEKSKKKNFLSPFPLSSPGQAEGA